MKPLAWVLWLGLGCLLSAGCGKPAGTSGGNQSEAERKGAEEASRIQRFEDLIGNGKKALEAKRFEEAVRDCEEAVRLQADPRARELLHQAHTARLNGLWVLSRQESSSSSFTVQGHTEGLLFEEDKVTDVRTIQTEKREGGKALPRWVTTHFTRGSFGPYKLDVSKTPRSIDIRWRDRAQMGIYKLDKETLTISWSEPGEKERPQDFNREKADIKYYVRVDLKEYRTQRPDAK